MVDHIVTDFFLLARQTVQEDPVGLSMLVEHVQSHLVTLNSEDNVNENKILKFYYQKVRILLYEF